MKKKTFVIIIVSIFLVLNALSFLTINLKTGTSLFNNGEYLEKKKSFLIKQPVDRYVHPFIGQIDLNNFSVTENDLTNEKLFYNIYESSNNSDDILKILLLGSSTAINFSNNTIYAYDLEKKRDSKESYNILAKKIETVFPKKKIIFYNAAIRSSKQPQQLFKLYYLYLLGMNFDIVINFDGPLEIVHPYLKNFPINDEAIYPRRYSDELAALTRDISCVKTNNEEVNKNSYVPLIELFSYLKIRNCYKKITKKEGIKNNWKSFTSIKEQDKEEILENSYKIWRNSSLEIENFSQLKNFFYLHVISPNQHVKKSKKFSEEEKNYLSYEYTEIISEYYERLVNFENLKLKNSLDLKYVFKDIKKTVYRDSCCRFNDLGIQIISEEIANNLKLRFN